MHSCALWVAQIDFINNEILPFHIEITGTENIWYSSSSIIETKEKWICAQENDQLGWNVHVHI